MTARRVDFPAWMKKAISLSTDNEVGSVLERNRLNTVCREATCPNRSECYCSGTATFLIMGSVCTRNCRFCDIHSGTPSPLDSTEPERVANAASELGLDYVVVTSVTRDDLPDGGAHHFSNTILALKAAGVADIEVLTSDFNGCIECVCMVADAKPSVFNHNVETIERLYPSIRPGADYHRSLRVLSTASRIGLPTKSGLMVGLGEHPEEVIRVLMDLRSCGVLLLTIGQYLSPTQKHHPVVEFVSPSRFDWYKEKALELGFVAVASDPFVRSSYMAKQMYDSLRGETGRHDFTGNLEEK